MNLSDVVDDTPLGVLKGLYEKKITFSTLFMRMCRYVDLQCVEITGVARVKGYTPGLYVDSDDPDYHHTWNAVRIDGYWHFLDCNWGISHVKGSVTFEPFRFEYDEHYFLADPEVMISSHYPKDTSWQLLDPLVSAKEFNRAVVLKPDFFRYGFELESHKAAVLSADPGEVDLRVTCPQGFLLSCRLSDGETGRESSAEGISYDQFEFIHRIREDTFACYIRIPDAGTFFLTIFAKRQFTDDGLLNIESPTEICQYVIHCTSPSGDRAPLPTSPADHWGPIGAQLVGLTPLSHPSGVIFSQDGQDVEVSFRKMRDIVVTHSLTCWNKSEDDLRYYAMQRSVDDRVIFTVSPPTTDRYGLHIFIYTKEYHRPVHLCSYLIIATKMNPSVQPFPALRENEHLGPSTHFWRLGLSHVSHHDPYTITQDSVVTVEIGKLEGLDFAYHFYFRGQVAHERVKMQVAKRQCSFILDVRQNGFYVLKVFARNAQLREDPLVHVVSYLVKKM